MNIVAVVGLRWIARSARVGAPSVTLWILAWAVFFIPLALRAHRAVEPPSGTGRHLRLGAPRVRSAARVRLPAGACGSTTCSTSRRCCSLRPPISRSCSGPRGEGLADNRLYSVVFVLGFLWFCDRAQHHRPGGRQSGCSISAASPRGFPPLLLIVCGAIAFATFGSATSFAPSELVPRDDVLTTMSLWSSMCFAFSGFEIASMVGQEVKNPRRTIPVGIIVAGVAVTAIYILSSASVLVAVPASELAERSGIADAVDLVTGRLGLAGMGALTGLLLAVGADRRHELVGGRRGAGPVCRRASMRCCRAAFARLHARYRTPARRADRPGGRRHAAVSRQRVRLARRRQTTVQESYDIMVNLTILVYFVPYLYLFAAWISLRRAKAAAPARGGDEHPGRHGRRVADRRVRLSRHADRDRPRVRAAARYRKHPQLRSQPRRPVAAAVSHRLRVFYAVSPPRADVVIVGGSVVGSSAAWHLREDGFTGRIVVVERDPTYRRASAFLAMGGIRQQFCTPVTVQMVQYSVGLWKEFDQRFAVAVDTRRARGSASAAICFSPTRRNVDAR